MSVTTESTVQSIVSSQSVLESIGCQVINCYLCEKRGIANPIVVKQQYSLLINYISSDRKIRPICDLHNNITHVKPGIVFDEPPYYFHPENPRYFCHQMTPDDKYAESHTSTEIERKTQIMQKIQQIDDEYQEQQKQPEQENEKLQPQFYHLMSRHELYQQARILEETEEQQKKANKAVISKWLSPPQPKDNTEQSITPNISQVKCCEPIRELGIENKNGYVDISHYLDVLNQHGF